MTMKKLISLIVFSTIFATAAFAQVSLDPPSTDRKFKNHRGASKPKRQRGRRAH
jgi:hypothetical protein